jgi:hypothetical protein
MRLALEPAVQAMDRLRGHPFVPPADVLAAIPKLYATEPIDLPYKVIHLHYFAASADWWLAEVEEDGELAFGYCNLGDPASAEWGYVSLRELALLEVPAQPVVIRTLPGGIQQTTLRPPIVVERDLHWTPKPWCEVQR